MSGQIDGMTNGRCSLIGPGKEDSRMQLYGEIARQLHFVSIELQTAARLMNLRPATAARLAGPDRDTLVENKLFGGRKAYTRFSLDDRFFDHRIRIVAGQWFCLGKGQALPAKAANQRRR